MMIREWFTFLGHPVYRGRMVYKVKIKIELMLC